MKKYFEIFDEARGKIPEHEARELILWASHMDMAELLNRFTEDAPDEIASRVEAAVTDRAEGKPLQYITHVQNFCGLDFYVDERVLIPRYDTEVLVEKVLADAEAEADTISATDNCGGRSLGRGEACRDRTLVPLHDALSGSVSGADVVSASASASVRKVLDLCTGSGCIAVALARLGGFDVTGCDISRDALEVADMNAIANGVDITFYESDMFSQIPCGGADICLNKKNGDADICRENVDCGYDIIVSNPPYIRSSVIKTLGTDVKDHEPRLALDGTADGLKFYRIIAAEAPKYFRKNQGTRGCASSDNACAGEESALCSQRCGKLYLEIGYDQAEDVKKLLTDAGFVDICVTKDLAGLDRVVSARYQNK